MYSSEFFYSHRWDKSKNNFKDFHIQKTDIEKIKSLKSFISNESGYYDTMLQWRSDDNQLSPEELNQLYPAMQFIAMLAKVSQEFITKYDVKKYHISLLRRLYLDWDDYDMPSITMAFKRPFGNSHVLGDVREEMVRYGDQLASERELSGDDDYSIEAKVLLEFVNILDNFYKEGFEVQVTSFRQKAFSGQYAANESLSDWLPFIDNDYRAHSYIYDWEPDLSMIRDNKINEIIT